MSLIDLSQIAAPAHALQNAQEYSLDVRNWARAAMRQQVDWNDFCIRSVIAVALGLAWAGFARAAAFTAMRYAALMRIGSDKVAPSRGGRAGRPSGPNRRQLSLTYPVRVVADISAEQAGVTAGAAKVGGLIMATPVAWLDLKGARVLRRG